MAKTVRAKPAWLFRRCRIGNHFPIVLQVEAQRRERERQFARLRVPSLTAHKSRFPAVVSIVLVPSAQRTCTKGALVHVAVFRAF